MSERRYPTATQTILAQRSQIAELETALRAVVIAYDRTEAAAPGAVELEIDLDDAMDHARATIRGIDGP